MRTVSAGALQSLRSNGAHRHSDPITITNGLGDRQGGLEEHRADPVAMLRVVAPHFVAGIVRGGAVAPIISYMKGWTLKDIRRYCARKGWSVEVLDQ